MILRVSKFVKKGCIVMPNDRGEGRYYVQIVIYDTIENTVVAKTQSSFSFMRTITPWSTGGLFPSQVSPTIVVE